MNSDKQCKLQTFKLQRRPQRLASQTQSKAQSSASRSNAKATQAAKL